MNLSFTLGRGERGGHGAGGAQQPFQAQAGGLASAEGGARLVQLHLPSCHAITTRCNKLTRPCWSPRLAGRQVRGFGFWYRPALGKRFLLAHNTPSIAHPFVAGWVFVFLVLLSCAGARCAASSLSLSSRA